jgi:glycerol kinase
MENDTGFNINELKADGGASVNKLLMQFQADISAIKVTLPTVSESTALGAAYLAGLAVGVWKNLDALKALWRIEKTYIPQMDDKKRMNLLKGWSKAVSRSLDWVEE